MDHYRFTTAYSSFLTQVIDSDPCYESLHELDWMLRVTDHITTLQEICIEVSWQTQSNFNYGTSHGIWHSLF